MLQPSLLQMGAELHDLHWQNTWEAGASYLSTTDPKLFKNRMLKLKLVIANAELVAQRVAEAHVLPAPVPGQDLRSASHGSDHGMVCCRMHGPRAFPSPMGRPAISKPMRTPSPKQRHPSGMFGLAQTPLHASLAQGIPSTPISGAMSAAAWLQDVATRGPAQVGLPALTVLRTGVSYQLCWDSGVWLARQHCGVQHFASSKLPRGLSPSRRGPQRYGTLTLTEQVFP